jgi:hypothetical protein
MKPDFLEAMALIEFPSLGIGNLDMKIYFIDLRSLFCRFEN